MSPELLSRFLERADSICELATITANEALRSERKVTAQLKAWCKQKNTQYGGVPKRKSALEELRRSIGILFEDQVVQLGQRSMRKEMVEENSNKRLPPSLEALPMQIVRAECSQRRGSDPSAIYSRRSHADSNCVTRRRNSDPGHFTIAAEDARECNRPKPQVNSGEPSPSCMPTLVEDREPSSGMLSKRRHKEVSKILAWPSKQTEFSEWLQSNDLRGLCES